MKMLNKFFPLLCLVAITFVSCKKDHGPDGPPVPKVKTVSSGNDIRTYYYDDKGRLTRIELALYGRQEYTYADTGVVMSNYNLSGTLTGKVIYRLNENNLTSFATSTFSPSDKDGYSYTADGQIMVDVFTRTTAGSPDRTITDTYYYTNNNLDSMVSVSNDVSFPSYTSYFSEYYIDKPNTIGNENLGQQFLGKSSKNPLKTSLLGTTSPSIPYTYTYEYDELNRIITQTKHMGTSTFAPITYTYY